MGGVDEVDRIIRSHAAELAQRPRQPSPAPPLQPRQRPNASLTRRRVEVLILVAEGLTNEEIAGHLFVSEETVKSHVRFLLSAAGHRNRAGLVGWAFRRGYLR